MVNIVNNALERITQGYSENHKAVDIGFSEDETNNIVHPNSRGIVLEVVDNLPNLPDSTGILSYGNYVLIEHTNGYKTRYAHLEIGVLVNVGDYVTGTTQIGVIGNSGNSFGRHLHYEVIDLNNERIDPTPYLTIPLSPDVNVTYKKKKFPWFILRNKKKRM